MSLFNLDQDIVTTANVVFITTSPDLYCCYRKYLQHCRHLIITSKENGLYRISVKGLNCEEADRLEERMKKRFKLVGSVLPACQAA